LQETFILPILHRISVWYVIRRA